MSRRVLVTGSEGFTGKYVCAEFSRAGWQVWGAGVQPKPHDKQYLQIDLLQPETLKPIADEIKPDVVIHLAAIAFVAESDPALFYQVNLIGTRNLLEALCHQNTPPEFTILASSANVYGNSGLEILSENSPTQPANDYAVSKLAMEYLAKTYGDRLPITITRPFNYTGVGQSGRFLLPKIVDHFKKQAPFIELGNLDVSRDFSDVRFIALAYRVLAEKPCHGGIFNLCSGYATPLRECISVCSEITGHSLEVRINPNFVRNNEVMTLRGDNTKFKTASALSSPFSLTNTLGWMINSQPS